MSEERTQIWSSGGGTQSSAIAALICMGELRPDLSVIVDTEYEASATWEYLDKWVAPALQSAGIKIHRVAKSKYATVGLTAKNGDVLIPAFTDFSGQIGKLPTYCSNEWKQRVMRRWALEQGVKQADVWLGITVDELRRVKQVTGRWQNRYPLIERRMTRGDCIALCKRMGWPEPPKSSCWMCPNRPSAGWAHQKANYPDDHAKAIAFDNALRKENPELWLLNTTEPLESANFSVQDDLFTGRCDSGYCFV